MKDIVQSYGFRTVGSRLKRIGERLQSDTQAVINDVGIAIQSHQYPLLFALKDHGPLEIGQLARTLGVSQPGITRNVGLLNDAGFVRIFAAEHDKRVRQVGLTELGRKTVERGHTEVAPAILQAFETIFGDKGPEFLALLDHLESELSEHSLLTLSKQAGKETK